MSEKNIKLQEYLYHGSRNGIEGNIRCDASRKKCDFGQGFYMGTNPDQAKSLVANENNPHFYTLQIDYNAIDQNRILTLKEMEWAYFVLFNRGRLNNIQGSNLCKHCQSLLDNYDLIIGPIADDAMNKSMNRFINGLITDKAFLESIKAIDYGTQYVAKAQYVCDAIQIVNSKELYGRELQDAAIIGNKRRQEGNIKAEEIQKRFRREGRYFDEIIRDIQNDLDRGFML